jgi:hypothetical protein
MIQRRVWTDCMVVATQPFDEDFGFLEHVEDLAVEPFVTELELNLSQQ